MTMKSTKQLARELGLLRKRSSSSHPDARWKRLKSKCQIFAYLIVIDFESTCWENTRNTPQEIIEFPAVLLNTATGQIEDEFHMFVLPQEHPILSEFCRTLTGITQEKVDDGLPLNICLSKFTRWLNRVSEEKKIKYNTGDDGFQLCTFATWSDWDLGVCLFYECKRKQLRKPVALNNWLDLRATYRKFYERKPNGLNGALKDLGIEFEGREHSGLDDARNTAKLAWRMIKDGCIMTITKSLDGNHAKTAPGSIITFKSTTNMKKLSVQLDADHIPIPDVTCNKTNNNKCTLNSNVAITSKPTVTNSISRQTGTSQVGVSRQSAKLLGERECDDGTLHFGNVVDRKVVLLDQSKTRELDNKEETSANVSDMEPDVLELGMYEFDNEETICVDKCDKVIKAKSGVLDDCDEKIQDHKVTDFKICDMKQSDSHLLGKGFGDSLFTSNSSSITGKKLTQEKFSIYSDSSSATSSTILKGCSNTPSVLKDKKNTFTSKIGETSKSSSLSTGPSGQKSTFKTPANRTPSFINGSVQGSFKTPFSAQRSIYSSTMKVTPPLCKCGRRSKRRVAQTPGPNQGRSFFSCPHGGAARNKGCGYFQWESAYMQNYSPQLFASPFAYAARSNRSSPGFDSVTQKLTFSSSGIDIPRKSLGVRPGIHANKRI